VTVNYSSPAQATANLLSLQDLVNMTWAPSLVTSLLPERDEGYALDTVPPPFTQRLNRNRVGTWAIRESLLTASVTVRLNFAASVQVVCPCPSPTPLYEQTF
jgi:hypothetical protein